MTHKVYATQGGGQVYLRDSDWVFVEQPPGFPNISIGDTLPISWGWGLEPIPFLYDDESRTIFDSRLTL